MYLGILIKEETLLKRLDKAITETVDMNNLKEELLATKQYEEAVCYTRTRVRIALPSTTQNTGGNPHLLR